MTSLPGRYKLAGRHAQRGRLCDLVVFDPLEIDESFADDGTPKYAKGISHVFINGQHFQADASTGNSSREGSAGLRSCLFRRKV